MKRVLCFLFVLLFAFFAFGKTVISPVIDGDWWQIAGNPDLGKYNSEKQQPVDFGIWQAEDGTWQLWSCIRFTAAGGHTRLFYRWQSKSITDANWEPVGIAMMSSDKYGEPLNGLQAPHVVKFEGKYWMAYGDWDNISIATSCDGKEFKRLLHKNNLPHVFSDGPGVNTRDAMLLFTKGKWHCYYTAFPAEHGYVYCRTTDDLLNYSDPVVVAYGGKAGDNKYSCECPHVVEVEPGSYVLFRTQYYGPGAQTSVYNSTNPYYFGIDDDTHYVGKLNLCAPEIVQDKGAYYIVALKPNLDGVRVAKLKWQKCKQD